MGFQLLLQVRLEAFYLLRAAQALRQVIGRLLLHAVEGIQQG